MVCKTCFKKVISQEKEPDGFTGRREYPYYCEHCDGYLKEEDVTYCVMISSTGKVTYFENLNFGF